MRRPKLVVSKCLGFENCRYNGQGSSIKLIDLLGEHVDFYTVCPEVEIGLSTQRSNQWLIMIMIKINTA